MRVVIATVNAAAIQPDAHAGSTSKWAGTE